MTAARVNLTIEQGATFTHTFIWKDENGDPIDLTGYTAEMDIRELIEDADPIIELTTANGRITLGGVAGTVSLLIADEDTAAIDIDDGVYDLELTDGSGAVTRLTQGIIFVNKEVTR